MTNLKPAVAAALERLNRTVEAACLVSTHEGRRLAYAALGRDVRKLKAAVAADYAITEPLAKRASPMAQATKLYEKGWVRIEEFEGIVINTLANLKSKQVLRRWYMGSMTRDPVTGRLITWLTVAPKWAYVIAKHKPSRLAEAFAARANTRKAIMFQVEAQETYDRTVREAHAAAR
jgi:hypothetical protein